MFWPLHAGGVRRVRAPTCFWKSKHSFRSWGLLSYSHSALDICTAGSHNSSFHPQGSLAAATAGLSCPSSQVCTVHWPWLDTKVAEAWGEALAVWVVGRALCGTKGSLKPSCLSKGHHGVVVGCQLSQSYLACLAELLEVCVVTCVGHQS